MDQSSKFEIPFRFFDVWLRLIVDELHELWAGVPTYNVLESARNRYLNLRVALLYTNHDFPGYGKVAGVSHQGYSTCPPCGHQLRMEYSEECRKFMYRYARCWVRRTTYLHSLELYDFFDGKPEIRLHLVAKRLEDQQYALQ